MEMFLEGGERQHDNSKLPIFPSSCIPEVCCATGVKNLLHFKVDLFIGMNFRLYQVASLRKLIFACNSTRFSLCPLV